MKKLRVLTVCGMGLGTSLMLLMNIEEIGKKHGVKIEGEAVDIGSYKGISCDIIVAASEIAKQLDGRGTPVVLIDNIIDKSNIEEKLMPYLL